MTPMPNTTTSPDSARQALALLLIAAETTDLKWYRLTKADWAKFDAQCLEHVRYINAKRGYAL